MTDMVDLDAAYFEFGPERKGRWLITCDHATNRVPAEINGGDLGIPAQDMNRHIAYDIGAEAVALLLGQLLDSPVLASNFSRLVIDPNRGEDDPTLVMKLYDGTIIPGNRHVDDAERERRLNAYHRPYHRAYAELVQGRAILAIHSFTPQLRGRPPRPWEIGVLFAQDTRLSDQVIAGLRGQGDITVGSNEPYNGHLPGDSVDRHGLRDGRPNALIELRNDLVADETGQKYWAERLAPIVRAALMQIQGT